jgi:acetyl-CoA carboxylase carboxyl transferase subunit alpha
LGIGIGDKVFMMENTWYSVISPESCSSILWRSWDYKKHAAEALKLTGEDMKGLGLVDDIIPEPLGGAHADRETTYSNVKKVLIQELDKLQKADPDKRVNNRLRKFSNMGVVAG